MATGDLKRLLELHEAFWAGEGETPLRRVSEHVPLEERGGIPLADGSKAAEGQYITPDLIDPRRFYGEGGRGPSVVSGDFIRGVGPPHLG